jgi:hypothetical protein
VRALAAAIVAGASVLLVTRVVLPALHHRPAGPPCIAVEGTSIVRLDLEQAANATTIAAVGKRAGLPNHAVTVALAAALQESGLHNLSGGDLDSVGLFQQRPSQGWGTKSQIMSPRYAATAFYGRLAQVAGWQGLAVTEAAQAVQRSAAPSAYRQWEAQARLLARTLTGEVPAGFSCALGATDGAFAAGPLSTAMASELGTSRAGDASAAGRGWTVASWLVGHAQQYRVSWVRFAGRRWSSGNAAWVPDSSAGPGVEFG